MTDTSEFIKVVSIEGLLEKHKYDERTYEKKTNLGSAAYKDIEIDDQMSINSENPVQNKVVKKYIDERISNSGGSSGGGGSVNIILDDEVSDESENGVQNRIIKKYVDDEISKIPIITIDSEIIINSENPVQSKVIKEYVDNISLTNKEIATLDEFSSFLGITV